MPPASVNGGAAPDQPPTRPEPRLTQTPGHAGAPPTARDADAVAPAPPPGSPFSSARDPFVCRDDAGWLMLAGASAGGADGSGAVLLYRQQDGLYRQQDGLYRQQDGLYRQQDGQSWRYAGVLCQGLVDPTRPHQAEVWERPQLAAVGDRWLLVVSVRKAGRADQVAAAVGRFDGDVFAHDGWQRLVHGPAAYGTTLFADDTGQLCMISLLPEAGDPGAGAWSGARSAVARLSVDAAGRALARPHPDLVADAAAARQNGRARLRLEPGGPQRVEFAVDGRDVHVVRSAASGVVALRRAGWPDEQLPAGPDSTGVDVLVGADVVEIFNDGAYGAWRLRPTPAPAPVAAADSAVEHAEFGRFRVETEDLDGPRSSAREVVIRSLPGAARSRPRAGRSNGGASRSAPPARLVWPVVLAIAVGAVLLAHLSQHRGNPNRPVAISSAAASTAAGPAPASTAYQPPARIRACPGQVNCLTTQSVPPGLVSSIRTHFPGSTVTCQASSFDGSVDEVTVQQVCLTSASGESLVLAEDRSSGQPAVPGDVQTNRVGSKQSVVVRRRIGWVLSVVITNPNSRTPDAVDVDAALAWTAAVALPD